ncbi:MAG TPA: DHA2 family efflux MFS transporter permease subunit [Solirubrobacteraceae bacterium]|jgi:EmrB/QacA subfamily drug resistance transporter|nr:DHA2 family efflux MFS transporter permease subunit [Solirubrobacteraceae bacterium]
MSAATLPAPVATSAPRVKVVFTGLMLVMLLAALDSTIVATALPTIVGDLGGLDRLSWVTSAYLLAQTAVTPLYGKLGDLLGRKRVLQSAVVLFLIGSGLCGLAGSMTMLIAFRAVQGLGAGGLIVLVQATVGDIVPPRERGRYQGLFGAVFGVASIAGPVLGGVIVEHISWRWIFYVNLPVGLVALFVLGATLPSLGSRGRPSIDYLGSATLAAALSGIVLVTSLGGTTWAWGSPQVILVGIVAVALLFVFVYVERHAREAVLPLAVLRDMVFRVAGSLSFIVGFALFGAVTFLPLYFQTVFHNSPTGSGLRLVPMMGGLLITSIGSGRMISRTGRYKPFPIAGTGLMVVGMILLSRLDVGTSSLAADLYLLVLGLGLGLVMQVLVLAVQNAVAYEVLGSATSGVTLTRGIGGSIGTAIFGTIFSTRLRDALRGVFSGPLASLVKSGGRLTGAQVSALPHTAQLHYEHAYVHALRPVFIVAAGVAAVGFGMAWMLLERPLRATASTSSQGLEHALAAPRQADSLAEIDRALATLVSREDRMAFGARVAERAGLHLSSGAAWALARLPTYGAQLAAETARAQGASEERIAEVMSELREAGLVQDGEGGAALTPAGQAMADQVLAARREQLSEMLADHASERDPALTELLERLSLELAGERP